MSLHLRTTTQPAFTMASAVFLCIVGISLFLLAPGSAATAQSGVRGDVEQGKAAYEATCGGCHSIDKHRIGPRHKGVIGRTAGTEPGYSYSGALKEAGFKWDAAKLDRWLQNPRAMVPGTKMAVRVTSAKRRADIIAYLETQ